MSLILSNLKPKILAHLDAEAEVVFEDKYLRHIWGTEEALQIWCDSWKLRYCFYYEHDVNRHIGQEIIPVRWLEIRRIDTPAEIELATTYGEERIFIDETDAGF